MDTTTSKETFYKTRTVAGRISAAFRFLKNHLSVFIRLSLYILLPLAFIQSLFFIFFSFIFPQFIYSVGYYTFLFLVSIISFIGLTLYGTLIYSLLKRYATEGGIPEYKSLKPLQTTLIKNFPKLLVTNIISLLIVGVLFVIPLLIKVNIITLTISFILSLFIIVPLSYSGIIYIFEKRNLIDTLKKAFKIGIKYWGGTFAIFILTGIITGAIQLTGTLPLLLGTTVSQLAYQAFTLGEAGKLPGYFPFLMFLLYVLSIYICYFAQLISVISLGYQYGNVEAINKEQSQEEEIYSKVL